MSCKVNKVGQTKFQEKKCSIPSRGLGEVYRVYTFTLQKKKKKTHGTSESELEKMGFCWSFIFGVCFWYYTIHDVRLLSSWKRPRAKLILPNLCWTKKNHVRPVNNVEPNRSSLAIWSPWSIAINIKQIGGANLQSSQPGKLKSPRKGTCGKRQWIVFLDFSDSGSDNH